MIDVKKHPECKHFGLVYTIAQQFSRMWGGKFPGGLEFDDLIQIGYLTLRRCYDLHEQHLSYICKALRINMRIAINQYRCLIKVPMGAHRLANFLEFGKMPPDLDTPKRRESGRQAQMVRKMVRRQIDHALGLLTIGLDEKWIDLEAINQNLKKLTPTEQFVLRLHYGFSGEEPFTFEQIGKLWKKKKVGRAAVHLVHRKAIRKLQQL